MLQTIRIITLMLIKLMLVMVLPAQYKFDKPVVISKEKGLPSHDVRQIVKDDKGFIWMATSGGLCRFDGTEIKVFKQGNDPAISMFDNSVSSVLAVKNKIWMGTSQGVSVFNTDDYTFRHYQFTIKGKTDSLKRRFDQNISVIYQDRAGKIWIGTTDFGVAQYEEAKDDFRFFPLPAGYTQLVPAVGAPVSILSICASETNDSVIWAGTTSGLQQINKYTGKVELITYPKENKNYQVALNAFRRLYHHDDGLLYVGSWAAGVNVFNPVTRSFTPIEVKSTIGKKIANSVSVRILRKSNHEFWLVTTMGLAVYNTQLKDISWYKLNSAENRRFYSINYIDDAGRIWCSDLNGVIYFDPVMDQFTSYAYSNNWVYSYYIIPDKTGNKITVCPRFTDCVYEFDKLSCKWSQTKFPGNEQFKKETDVVKGFVQLSPGEYIVAADKGIYKYSANKKTIRRVNDGYPFGVTRRADMIADRKGNVWITDNTWGLTKWNPDTGKFKVFTEETLRADTISQASRLMNLYEDSRSNIWFQIPGGIGVYDAGRDKIDQFVYSKNETNSFPRANGFAEDKNGRVWVSSADGGFGYALTANPQQGVLQKINIREKGIDGEVLKLATDINGDVWGYTINELIKISADSLTIRTYDFKYGANELSPYAFLFLSSGEMVFGGRNDIIIANPAELKRNEEIPVPYIAEINVLNQPYNFYQNNEKIKLGYRQNFFSIGFSSIAYTLADGVKYRFRLSGFDDWSEPTNRRYANYTNVPGDDYVFQLQAANNEGLWNEKILELPIYVATPFWQTWWFRTVAILLFAGIIYAFYRFRVNQFRKKEKMKSEYEKKLANVEMSSLLAQMNPHFLFNSLNSIDSYIIRNESRKASEYLNNFARLIRLILQNSRSNYITLKDELEALDLYMQMEGLRFNNKFAYEIKVDEGIDTSGISIPPMLIQPYVENAIWHGLMHKSNGETGKVEILLSTVDQKLKCVVQDNGIGRGKAEELKAQKSSNRKRSMGMQITRDRIEMINKLYGSDTRVEIIDLLDKNGEPAGTRVELVIPV